LSEENHVSGAEQQKSYYHTTPILTLKMGYIWICICLVALYSVTVATLLCIRDSSFALGVGAAIIDLVLIYVIFAIRKSILKLEKRSN